MRVLLIAQYFPPESVGAAVWIHQLATGLLARGHKVTMLTAFPNHPARVVFKNYRGKLVQREWLDGIEVIRTWICSTPRNTFWSRVLNFGSFCASSNLGGFMTSRPDVIYCILPPLPLGVTAKILGVMRSAPVVLNIQDIFPEVAVSLGYLKSRSAISFFGALERALYRWARGIVVISDGFRQNLLRKGVPECKLHVVPNWADSREIRPGPKDNAFRASLSVGDQFTVVYAGGITHNSSLEVMIEAARLLRNEPFQFFLIGDGIHKPVLQELVRNYHLEGTVHFLDFQPWDHYPEVLAASDVQVVTLNLKATNLSLPSKVFKIMAGGRPILAAARGNSDLCRLLQVADCGMCVDPNDPISFSGALRLLASDSTELERMGKNSRQYLVEHFDCERCVDSIEDVLSGATREPVLAPVTSAQDQELRR